LIDSVLAVGSVDVVAISKRANAILNFRKHPDFDRAYPAFNRVLRILPDENIKANINPELFQDDSENALYNAITGVEDDIKEALKNADYNKMLDKLISLCDSIDVFFERVMVMAEETNIRENRLALLERIASMFYLLADFSKLVVQ
jgi:glycyl-tRNA synthetase beta subunit